MHSQEDLKCLCIMRAGIKQAKAPLSPGAQTHNKPLLKEVTKREVPTDVLSTSGRSGRGEAARACVCGTPHPELTSGPEASACLSAPKSLPLGWQRSPTLATAFTDSILSGTHHACALFYRQMAEAPGGEGASLRSHPKWQGQSHQQLKPCPSAPQPPPSLPRKADA